MKAEHRKELETNALAEGMGHLITRVRARPKRGVTLYVVIFVAVILAIVLGIRFFEISKDEAAQSWLELQDGSMRSIELLIKDSDTNAGKAALLEKCWYVFWEEGFKNLGRSPQFAVKKIEEAGKLYDEAARRCAGDPVFEPEALYGKACVEETRALFEPSRLKSAREQFEQLASAHAESAFGKRAKQRADALKDDKQGKEIARFYDDLRSKLHIQPAAIMPPFDLPGDKKAPAVPPAPPPAEKK